MYIPVQEKGDGKCDEIEINRNRNELRKFSKNFKHQTECSSSVTAFCMDGNGNLVTVTISVSGNNDINTFEPIVDYNVECTAPSQDDVRLLISRLKNSKATLADCSSAKL